MKRALLWNWGISVLFVWLCSVLGDGYVVAKTRPSNSGGRRLARKHAYSKSASSVARAINHRQHQSVNVLHHVGGQNGTKSYTCPECDCSNATNFAGQYDTLADFYNATEGNGWISATNWLQNNNFDSWKGIHASGCDVQALRFDFSNNLNGSISSSIAGLRSLIWFEITNQPLLTGSIPPEIANISGLGLFILESPLGTGKQRLK
jgi:hypothetical protein